MSTLTPAKAHSCIQLGRCTEHVYTELKEFFSAYDNSIDLDSMDFAALCYASNIEEASGAQVDDILFDLFYDRESPNSICSIAHQALDAGLSLRSEIGDATIGHIEVALSNLRKSKAPSTRLIKHRAACDDLLAFWGSVEDGDAPATVKALIFLGKYSERIDLYARFKKPVAKFAPSIMKIGFYFGSIPPDELVPIKPVLMEIVSDVSKRGYEDQASFLRVFASSCDKNPAEDFKNSDLPTSL